MTTLADALRGEVFRRLPKAELDPFRMADQLVESVVVDLKIDPVRDVVAIVFDLRTALQARKSSTGVLVGRSVREVSWIDEQTRTGLYAPVVISSTVDDGREAPSVSLAMLPKTRLEIGAREMWFVDGVCPDFLADPPDLTSINADSLAAGGFPNWNSAFRPTGFVELRP